MISCPRELQPKPSGKLLQETIEHSAVVGEVEKRPAVSDIACILNRVPPDLGRQAEPCRARWPAGCSQRSCHDFGRQQKRLQLGTEGGPQFSEPGIECLGGLGVE